jgi:hypothetical protein
MIYLSNRCVLQISGPDALPFLQGLCTNDVQKLNTDSGLYAIMLTPQGKYFGDFFLYAGANCVMLDCAKDRADDLLKKLNMYKLRSDVQISQTNLKVFAVEKGWGATDPRSAKLYDRVITNDSLPEGKLEDYSKHLLEYGVPDSSDFIVDKTFPMHYRLEDLHGVSFEKGCYVGQENTARMKYKGTVRKSIYKIEGENLPEFGAEIDGLGIMLSSQGNIGLALCEIEAVEKFSHKNFRISQPEY